jgi:hypothetical protein
MNEPTPVRRGWIRKGAVGSGRHRTDFMPKNRSLLGLQWSLVHGLAYRKFAPESWHAVHDKARSLESAMTRLP